MKKRYNIGESEALTHFLRFAYIAYEKTCIFFTSHFEEKNPFSSSFLLMFPHLEIFIKEKQNLTEEYGLGKRAREKERERPRKKERKQEKVRQQKGCH